MSCVDGASGSSGAEAVPSHAGIGTLLLDILARMTEQLAAGLADEEQLSPSLLILGPPGVGEFSWHRLSRIAAASGVPLGGFWAPRVGAVHA